LPNFEEVTEILQLPAMLGGSDELKGFRQPERRKTQITIRATVFIFGSVT
jgi:hypothetical protein